MDLAEESTPLYSIRNHFFRCKFAYNPTHTEIFNDLLKLAVDSDVSDIVIKTNKLGYVRFAGQLKPVDMDSLLGEDIRAFVEEHVPKVFRPPLELDLSGRFCLCGRRSGTLPGKCIPPTWHFPVSSSNTSKVRCLNLRIWD